MFKCERVGRKQKSKVHRLKKFIGMHGIRRGEKNLGASSMRWTPAWPRTFHHASARHRRFERVRGPLMRQHKSTKYLMSDNMNYRRIRFRKPLLLGTPCIDIVNLDVLTKPLHGSIPSHFTSLPLTKHSHARLSFDSNAGLETQRPSLLPPQFAPTQTKS